MKNYKKPKPGTKKPGTKKPKMELVANCGKRRGCIVTILPMMKAA